MGGGRFLRNVWRLPAAIGSTIISQCTDKPLSISSEQWRAARRWTESGPPLIAVTWLLFSELPQVTDTAKQGALVVWEGGKAGRIQDPSLLRVITQPKAERPPPSSPRF